MLPGISAPKVGFHSSGAITDPDWADVVLLMGFDGPNGSFTTGWFDESSYVHGELRKNASSTPICSTAQFKFGTAAGLFTSSGDGGNWASSTDWVLGAGLFTIEMFAYFTAVTGVQYILSRWGTGSDGANDWKLQLNGTTLEWHVSTTGSDDNLDIAGSWVASTGAWHHIALDYDGTKYRMYVDGTMVGSSVTARTISSVADVLSLGSNYAGSSNFLTAYLDELRITKGVARYASDSGFTVPTAMFPRS